MSGAPLALKLTILGIPLFVLAFARFMPGLYVGLWPMLALPPLAIAAWALAGPGLVGVVALIAVSPEYHIGSNPPSIIALHKALVILLVAIIIVRRGFSGQFNGPALAFIGGFCLTMFFGQLYPTLVPAEMLRSLLGSIAPFLIIWARTDRRLHGPMVLVAAICPLISVAAGAVLTVVTGRAMFGFDQYRVMRFQGASIPAFLGYLGEIGTMAAFAEYARTGRERWLWLAGLAYACILASGTRVPMATALLFCLIVLCFARGLGTQSRLRLWLLGGVGAVAVALLLGPSLMQRTFGRGGGGGLNMSGRDVIWPLFTAAIARHPLFGQGIGTGRFLVDPEEVKYIGTVAVHNEYLRLSADMGIVGVVMLVLGHVVWLAREWRWLSRAERAVVAAFGLAFALHSVSDNTLIAPQAVILYAWLATFVERARRRAEDEGRLPRRQAPLMRGSGV